MKHVLAALTLVAATGAPIESASAQSFTYPDFHDVSNLTLNGNAYQNPSGNKLTLTNATDGQSGSAWSTQKIHLGSQASFSSVFSFEMPVGEEHTGLVQCALVR